jgi:hypothetical protein
MERGGCYLGQEEIERIVRMLETTELTLIEIATCTSSSKAAVCEINRKWKVRDLFRKPKDAADSHEDGARFDRATVR